jgi:hypothetical protein
MIAIAQPARRSKLKWQHRFLEVLPAIRRQARHAFHSLDAERSDDAIAEVIANAYCGFCRLVQAHPAKVAYATPLAHYAIAQYWAGRRVGASLGATS